MAASNKLFQRYIWLVDTVYSAGEITRDEIDRRWANSAYNYDHESRYSERNFHRHREAILEMFGIDIVCNHATKRYSIGNLGDMNEGGVRSWLIDTFAINNMVNLAGDMQNRILFERIPEGSRFLSSIVSAMKEEKRLLVTYQRFDRPEPHSFLLDPYCLKVFKQRWYLVGKPDARVQQQDCVSDTAPLNQGATCASALPTTTLTSDSCVGGPNMEYDGPRVYALDRVHDIAITDKEGRAPHNFNPEAFFENQFGVDRRLSKPEKIRVKVKSLAANYLRTLPIHDSQMEIEQKEDYSVFAFYLAPTYDFVQELRKHGSNLEVLEPEHLREDFKQESARLGQMYWD